MEDYKKFITKGEWITDYNNSTLVEIRSKSNLSKPISTLSSYYFDEMVTEFEELKSNAQLIAEAGTVTNESGFTPRELLEQRDELLKALKNVRQWYEGNQEHYLGEYTPIVFSEALSAIQKTTP